MLKSLLDKKDFPCLSLHNRIPLVRAGVCFDLTKTKHRFLCLIDTGSINTRVTSKGMMRMRQLGLDPDSRSESWREFNAPIPHQRLNSCVGFYFDRGPGLWVNHLYYLRRPDSNLYEMIIGRDLMEQAVFEYHGLHSFLRLLAFY